MTLGERFDDVWTLALALRYQGDIAINVDGDLDQAEKLLADSIAAAGELDDAWAMSRSLLFAGWVPWTREDYDGAESLWQRALELAEEHDDSWARVRALTALSINKSQQEDLEGAIELVDQAVSWPTRWAIGSASPSRWSSAAGWTRTWETEEARSAGSIARSRSSRGSGPAGSGRRARGTGDLHRDLGPARRG